LTSLLPDRVCEPTDSLNDIQFEDDDNNDDNACNYGESESDYDS